MEGRKASYIIKNPMERRVLSEEPFGTLCLQESGQEDIGMRIHKIIGSFFCVWLLLFFRAAAVPRALALESTGKGILSSEISGETETPRDAAGSEGGYVSPDFTLYAAAAVLMDADSGRVLYGKNEDTSMAMASTTKIMTCILVLENASLDEELTVSAYAASMPKVKLYLQKGERYRVEDLLYSLMLESHNDSAVALAEHVGRKYLPQKLQEKEASDYTAEESRQAVAAFAVLMNRKAEELGCENTWFITPNGLDATETIVLEDGGTLQKDHCTTAEELARIMSYCIKESEASEDFLELTGTRNYSFYANDRSYSCVNHNAFLDMMEGAVSGKTGFTNKAGYCYVGALERDGRTFVVALLACGWPNNKSYKWSDTRKLMQYGIDNYFYRSFSEEGVAFEESRLQSIPVRNGQTSILGETARTEVEIADRKAGAADETESRWKEGLLLRADEKIRVECRVKNTLTAPVSGGTEVGWIDYMVGDTVYKRESIVTKDSVGLIDPEWCLKQILFRFLIFSGT